MNEQVLQTLQSTIEKKESIIIRYNGGSQPESIREIIPTKISGNKIYAFCKLSSANKCFVMDKIDIDGFDNCDSYFGKEEIKVKHLYKTIEECFNDLNQVWVSKGFLVKYNKDYLYLFKLLDNGKTNMYPDVGIENEDRYTLLLNHRWRCRNIW